MKNTKANKDNKANQLNPNKGTSGNNIAYDKAQGNRGKQMNPSQTGKDSPIKDKQ